MKKYLLSFAVMMGSALLTGCLGDDDKNKGEEQIVITEGAIVVNNGSMYNGIDGSMSFLDYTTGNTQQNVYKTANGASLGGTPNDAVVYGKKLYVAGSDENTLFVLDAKTFKEIKKISTTDMLGAEKGVNPRHLAVWGGRVYVSTYGGYVAEIDTLGLNMTRSFEVGSAPEGMAISSSDDDKTATLYVANSDYGYGNGSISIISLTSGSTSATEFKSEKIHNPQEIAAAGDVLFVLDWGYYDESWNQKEAGVYCIYKNEVTKVIPDATGMSAAGYTIITYNDPYGSQNGPSYSVYDTMYGTLRTFILKDESDRGIFSPSAISIDPNSYNYTTRAFNVMIASRPKDPDTGYPSYAMPGYVNVYDSNGKFIKSFDAGVEPHKIEFSYGLSTIVWN